MMKKIDAAALTTFWLASACIIVAAWCLPVANATPAAEISIPGHKVYPESLTTRADGSILIGSIGERAIYRVKPGAASAETWIKPPLLDKQGIFGVFADPQSGTLWACASTPGVPGGPPPPQSVLHTFDLETGTPKAQYPLPTAGAFCNDIAVGQDGTAYVSDTNNMEIVRLKRGAKVLEVWAGGGAFGPKGGVLDGISVLGKRVLVNTLGTGKLFSVPIGKDGQAGSVTEVRLDRAIGHPDGMRSFGRNDVLIIEGGSGGRLSRITLNGDSGKVTTIKEGYPDGPVAVTVVGTTAYVLEGQLALLFGGDPNAPEHPYHATAVEVGKP
jgi:sugar lactone lactonase YvrE